MHNSSRSGNYLESLIVERLTRSGSTLTRVKFCNVLTGCIYNRYPHWIINFKMECFLSNHLHMHLPSFQARLGTSDKTPHSWIWPVWWRCHSIRSLQTHILTSKPCHFRREQWWHNFFIEKVNSLRGFFQRVSLLSEQLTRQFKIALLVSTAQFIINHESRW